MPLFPLLTVRRLYLGNGARYAVLLLITNRKSHMSFRLVPNSVILDDPEQRNSPNRRVISSNSVAFGADCVKVVEDTSSQVKSSQSLIRMSIAHVDKSKNRHRIKK